MLKNSLQTLIKLLAASAFVVATNSYGQTPVMSFENSASKQTDLLDLKTRYGAHKLIPGFEQQILTALSYFPELSNASIKFRFKHRNVTFTARPTVLSLFRARKNRRYLITISDSCKSVLKPVMFKNMPIDAQIGAIGHELSHLADFNDRNFFSMMSVVTGHLSRRYLDKFEFRTDSICIAHGLGFQLLAWSKFIRATMHTANWTGSGNINHGPMIRERYMNPDTIYKRIKEDQIYVNISPD